MAGKLSNNSGKSVQRNEKGQLLPGVVLNPGGKPKGVRHMSTLLAEAIKRVAEDTGTSHDVEIVQALVTKAKSGDMKAIDTVFDRVDGKAEQKIDITSNEETIGASSEIKAITEQLNELYRNRS